MGTFYNPMTPLFLFSFISIILVFISIGHTNAQSGSCTSVLISMSPCLNYITGKSPTPTTSCCSSFDNVLKTKPVCLCEVINGGDSTGIGISINQTLALALPDACKIQTPPLSKCQEDHSPTASPGISPGMPPEPSLGSPVSSSVQDGTGSKSSTSTNGCSMKMSLSGHVAVIVGLIIAVCFA